MKLVTFYRGLRAVFLPLTRILRTSDEGVVNKSNNDNAIFLHWSSTIFSHYYYWWYSLEGIEKELFKIIKKKHNIRGSREWSWKKSDAQYLVHAGFHSSVMISLLYLIKALIPRLVPNIWQGKYRQWFKVQKAS